MAVGSIDNKIKGKNSKNKYTGKRRKKVVTKKEVISELILELEKVIEIKEKSVKKKSIKKPLIISILLFILSLIILIPKIHLKGDRVMTINYTQEYVEPGYNAKFLWIDITKYLKIKNKIMPNKVGDYTIEYYLKYKKLKIKRVRKVSIIDDIIPEIEVEKDVINICPNDEIPEFEYIAKDEYDGILTDKVEKEYAEDKVILTVKDNSNNIAEKEILIDREDKTKPTIELKGNSTMYITVGSGYNEPGYKATDNCDGDLTDKVKVEGTVESSVGTYTLTYSVSDNNENKEEVTRTVIVRNSFLYNNGSIGNGVIYLTFDDGPSEGTTNVILDILSEEGVPATFFVTCNGPDYLISRIYNEGHTLALHTCTHNYSIYSSVDTYFNDLNNISNRVKNITGYDSKIIRFPGGSSNTVSRNYSYGIMTTLTGMVLDKGYRYYDWNVDSNDAGGASSSSAVYYNVIRSLSYSRSNVILMHDIKPQTRDALRDIIRYGKDNGYTFGKITMDTYMVRHGVNN